MAALIARGGRLIGKHKYHQGAHEQKLDPVLEAPRGELPTTSASSRHHPRPTRELDRNPTATTQMPAGISGSVARLLTTNVIVGDFLTGSSGETTVPLAAHEPHLALLVFTTTGRTLAACTA